MKVMILGVDGYVGFPLAISANGSDLERLRKFWGGKENLELLDISMQNNGVIISKKDLKDTSKSM